jgi:hypothetical protein
MCDLIHNYIGNDLIFLNLQGAEGRIKGHEVVIIDLKRFLVAYYIYNSHFKDFYIDIFDNLIIRHIIAL